MSAASRSAHHQHPLLLARRDPPANALDAVLDAWWRLHIAFDRAGPVDGNIREGPHWRPRARAPLHAAALVLACFASWLLLRLPPASLEFAAVAHVCVLSAAGFAYTNFVTTHRRSPFVGKHGGPRDLVTVLLAAPLVAAGCLLLPRGLARALWPALSAPASFSRDGGLLAATALHLGFMLGLHAPYATRRGLFSGSLVAHSGSSACGSPSGSGGGSGSGVGLGMALKLTFILGHVLLHLRWAWLQGVAAVAARCAAYAALWGGLALVTRLTRRRYYLHLHHWFLGAALLPFCVLDDAFPFPVGSVPARPTSFGFGPQLLGVRVGVLYSLLVTGFALSQFVEGAARWSCAPLWHARQEGQDEGQGPMRGRGLIAVSSDGKGSGSDAGRSCSCSGGEDDSDGECGAGAGTNPFGRPIGAGGAEDSDSSDEAVPAPRSVRRRARGRAGTSGAEASASSSASPGLARPPPLARGRTRLTAPYSLLLSLPPLCLLLPQLLGVLPMAARNAARDAPG